MTCPHCGSVLRAGQPVCPDCGKPARNAAPPGESAVSAQPPSAANGGAAGRAPPPARDKSRDFDLVGKTIAGKYRVLEVLGQGGFGTVYLVEITAGMVGERLALKILPETLSSRKEFVTQFHNEIRVAMRLVDRYIVQIRDVGTTADGLLYYTMDYCPGTTLAHVLRQEGRLAIPRALLIALNILRALQTAHAAGIIHRDLKPANIMVEEQAGKETLRILDFGIATAIAGRGPQNKGFAGSPPYMPPEQFLGAEVGFSSDLYSVGVIIYEAITATRPHTGKTPKEVFQSLKTKAVTRPEALNPEVNRYPGLSDLTLRCLERNPEKRYQSARELFDAVNAVLVRGTTPQTPGTAAPQTGSARRRAAGDRPGRRPQPAPGPAARAAAERIRRSRPALSRRRARPRIGAAVLATLLGVGVVAGVASYKDILSWFRSLENPVEQPGEAPGKDAGSGEKPPKRPVVQKGNPAARQPTTQPHKAGPAEKDDREAVKAEATRRLVEQARKALAAENWPGVLAATDKALKLDPRNAESFFLQGKASLALGAFSAAEASLEKARELSAKPSSELLLALARAKAGLTPPRLEEAAALALQAAAAAPSDPAAILAIAGVLEKAGREDDLRKLLAGARGRDVHSPQVDKLYDKYLLAPEREKLRKAGELLAAARTAFDRKAYPEALKKARLSGAAVPSLEADLLIGECLMEAGKTGEGLQLVEKSLEAPAEVRTGSKEAVAGLEALQHYFEGMRLLDGYEAGTAPGSPEKALAEFRAARERNATRPAKVGLRLGLRLSLATARAAALGGDVDGTRKALTPLEGNKEPALVFEAAQACFNAARHTDIREKRIEAYGLARERYSLAVAGPGLSEPQRREAFFRLGLSQLRLGDLTAGERYWRMALEAFASAEQAGLKHAELYENWSDAYARTGNRIRAAQCLRQAYDAAPTAERCARAVEAYLEANPASREARELRKECQIRFGTDFSGK